MIEKKQKIEQELDQMEKVTGGIEWVKVSTEGTNGSGETGDEKACPWCKQFFPVANGTFHKHLLNCPSAPPAPIIIG